MSKNKKSTPRLSRLIGILIKLNMNEWVSASSLADQFFVSIRTIYRDISDLQNLGFEITGTTGNSGGYSLNSRLSTQQMHNFDIYNSVKAELVVRLGKKSIEQKMPENTKLENTGLSDIVYSIDDKIIFDVSDWYWKDNIDCYSAYLSKAIKNQKTLKINYMERNTSQIHSLEIDPLGMAWKAGYWYLIFKDCRKNVISRLRTNRIVKIEETNESFDYPSGFNLNSWWKNELIEFGRGNIKVVIKVSGKSAIEEYLKMDEKPDTKKTRNKDILVVEYYVDNWQWLVPIILQYGASVIVAEPAELRTEIISIINSMMSQYNTDVFENIGGGEYINNDSRERISKSRQE